MSLPIFTTTNKDLSLLQTTWKALLDQLLRRPQNFANIIQNVSLANGTTVINHLLGRKMQGWFIADIQGAATIYRSQPFNDLTLTLVSNAAVTVSIGVF